MTDEPMSLREYDRVADRVRQHRQASDEPVLIVEGPDDQLVLMDHLRPAAIFPADGKVNAVACARTLIEWKVLRFICVTDRDFEDPGVYDDLGDWHHSYSSRDLEAMAISLGVLARVLEHLGSKEKIQSFGGADALVQKLSAAVLPVTYLRFINNRENWGLSFDKVSLASKINQRNLVLETVNYCSALLQASESRATAQMLHSAIAEGAIDEAGARGKDVIIAAGVALRRMAGSLQHAVVEEAVLTAQVHSSCGLALSRSAWLLALKKKLACD